MAAKFQYLANQIARKEGIKDAVDIAKISEILKITLDTLNVMPFEEVCELMADASERRRQDKKEAVEVDDEF